MHVKLKALVSCSVTSHLLISTNEYNLFSELAFSLKCILCPNTNFDIAEIGQIVSFLAL